MSCRRIVRILLVTSAVVAGGCSGDASRFGDFYANAAPTGAVPPGLDMRATSSVGPGLVPGVPVGGTANPTYANAAPVAPSWAPPRAGAPTRLTGPSNIDRRPTGSVGTVARAPLAPLGGSAKAQSADAGPVPLPPVETQGSVVRTNAAATSERSGGIAQRVRDVVSSPIKREPRQVAAMEVPRSEALDRVVTASPREGGWTATGGTRVTVGAGETLYNLSKRYGVPVVSIMDANGISDPTTVRLGQQLVIPTYVYSRTAKVSAPDNDPNVRASSAGRGMMGEVRAENAPLPSARPGAVSQTVLARAPAAPASGGVVVQSGDTLYAIARRSGVTVEALKAANGMTTDAIAIGQTLRVPGASAPQRRIDPVVTASLTSTTPSARVVEAPVAASVEPEAVVKAEPKALPRVMKPETIVASADPVAAPQRSSAGKLRWPVKGRVVSSFGGEKKGVDIAVPPGSPVRAAENGTVIYAGSSLKQFGNTVLIQHDDGLVTVYGHAQTLNVAKGQKVSRGDVIAASGMTGNAASPRVHFQVRKGSSPVDPSSYLN